jgi:hypothetical protein
MANIKRDMEWLLSLTPRQIAGASKVISDAQLSKASISLRKHWANPLIRKKQSERMTVIKKDWSWAGTRSGGNNPNSKVVITPNGSFASVKEAARYYGVTGEAIRYRISKKHYGYAYEGEPIGTVKTEQAFHPAYRWVETPIGNFFTLVAAAKALGVVTVTVRSRIKRRVPGYAFIDPPGLVNSN